MADYENMDTLDESASLDFDLYYNKNHEATLASGSVKSYETKESGSAIYETKRSGYSVTVERLLWVDGWEKTTLDENKAKVPGKEMTLVVLKFVLAPHDRNRKIGYVKATLVFEDDKWKETGGKNEPQVEAWAPFHTQQRWNPSAANYKKTDTKNTSITAGYSGVSLTGGWTSQGEISFDRAAFDEGRSNAELSRITKNRNGVSWVLAQNELHNAGISQEFWGAVLLSRQTKDPYQVKFQIDARVGTFDEFEKKVVNIFGSNPSKTKPFLVTPWAKRVVNFEGKDIIKSIDLENLGTLQSRIINSDLDVKWGPNYEIKIPTPPKVEETSSEGTVSEDNTKNTPTKEVLPASTQSASGVSASTGTAAAAPTQPSVSSLREPQLQSQPPPPQSTPPQLAFSPQPMFQAGSTLPPLMIGWYNPASTTNADSRRLTTVEARTAQIEARLAQQDSLILQLQQALIASNAQVTRLGQAIGN